jgi:hypothetical protein
MDHLSCSSPSLASALFISYDWRRLTHRWLHVLVRDHYDGGVYVIMDISSRASG